MDRDSLARRQFSRPGPQRGDQIGEIRPPGIIRLGEAAPILQRLRARMRARELYSDDLPAGYLRLLYGLTDDTPIDSRVDQLAKENRGAGVFMAEVERARSGDQAL